MKSPHIPVLLQEVMEQLNPKSGANFIDATLGFGGHSAEILAATAPDGKLIGIDQDKQALEYACERLGSYGERFIPYLGNYTDIDKASAGMVVTGGILADIGVSSFQLDEAERGFSFKENGPLDMRMDRTASLTAKEIVNEWDEAKLTEIIKEYGEERFAKRISGKIVQAREIKHIETTRELADIVSAAIPRKFWPEKVNPATKTFQAIRIAVNDELGVLTEFLPKAVEILQPGARLAVITFHSLEDRIVKDFMRERANPCSCPPEFPKCVCGKTADVKLLSRRPIEATSEEVRRNPRSRSAKLRVIEKI